MIRKYDQPKFQLPNGRKYGWPYQYHSTYYGFDICRDTDRGGYQVFYGGPYSEYGKVSEYNFDTLKEQREWCKYVVMD